MASTSRTSERGDQRIAVPVAGGRLAEHFGHCEEFVIFGADAGGSQITQVDVIPAPEHRPGLLPEWLGDMGVHVVIAAGLGSRAQELFRLAGIEVIAGAARGEPREIVQSFLEGTLTVGPNVCDH